MLFVSQLNDHQLGAVVDAQGAETVAQTAADNHAGAALFVQPCIVFGEEPLMGCDDTSELGQTYLPTMGVTAQR